MPVENTNQNRKPKLVFDVMPEAMGEPVPQNTEGDLQSGEPMEQIIKPPRPVQKPSMDMSRPKPVVAREQASLPPPAKEEPQIRDSDIPTGSFLNKRYVIGAVIAIVLGIAGYFGYSWFTADEVVEEPDILLTTSQPDLPEAWLTKHFKVTVCEDKSICGLNADPDKDGLKNRGELDAVTDPNNADTDYDGIADLDELQVYNTDPIVADTDGDKYEDGIEVRNGYSPNINSSSKISILETQVFEENIERFGLHEPTVTFLSLEPFIGVWRSGGNEALTTSLYFAHPENWTKHDQINYVRRTSSPDSYMGRLSLIITNTLSTSTQEMLEAVRDTNANLKEIQKLESYEINVGGLDFLVEEGFYLPAHISPGESTAGPEDEFFQRDIVLAKDGTPLFVVTVIAQKNVYENQPYLVDLISFGIRLWPFK